MLIWPEVTAAKTATFWSSAARVYQSPQQLAFQIFFENLYFTINGSTTKSTTME